MQASKASKRARQAGGQASQASRQASWLPARDVERRERRAKEGIHDEQRTGRGWDESEKRGEGRGIDRTTRTEREYIPQHGSMRRRGRWIYRRENSMLSTIVDEIRRSTQ
ncbi:uncharacterized protein LOC143178917 [Calliopsis andreniformis]|uniref:uncharacterized protein LOC143178917 n=1 Tax=Calliopsis andreniformis TaxID=337506 RepID=UPI003FCCAA29